MKFLTVLWVGLCWLGLAVDGLLFWAFSFRLDRWEVKWLILLLHVGALLSCLSAGLYLLVLKLVRQRERGEQAPLWRRRVLWVSRSLAMSLPVASGLTYTLILWPPAQDVVAGVMRLLYVLWST